MRRHRIDVLTALTATALAVLGAFAAWAVISLSATTAEISRASARVVAYQDLQETVAAQAVAEAGHRRAPSPAARLRLDAAVADVTASVGRLREVADPGEGAMLSYLLLQNHRYVTETERTLELPASVEPDDRVAGPALDAVQQLVSAAIGVNQEALDDAVERQRRLVASLGVLLPAVMAIATAALVLGIRASRARARELAAVADEAHRRSLCDPLTGLANRAGFEAAFAAVDPDRADTAVLLVDVDHFKQVNDTHGHSVGDAVLVALGGRMRDALRPGDTLARLGGDEFVAVLPRCQDPRPAAERLRAAVAEPLEVQGAIVLPTVSIGVARHPADGTDTAAVLHAADEALYRSKAAGRDRVSEARPRSLASLPDL
jgi:diguanylate cyclase (GGDEF)-like protein